MLLECDLSLHFVLTLPVASLVTHHVFIRVLSSGFAWFVCFDCKLFRAGSSAGLQPDAGLCACQLQLLFLDYFYSVTLVSIKTTYSEKTNPSNTTSSPAGVFLLSSTVCNCHPNSTSMASCSEVHSPVFFRLLRLS